MLMYLAAGVALMALGTLADHPDCGLKIVPCGMNYFHAHKFRSRAVIEFGNPITVPQELVDLFRKGERRESVGSLLDMIYDSLQAVTLTGPDYDTLMVCLLFFFFFFFFFHHYKYHLLDLFAHIPYLPGRPSSSPIV